MSLPSEEDPRRADLATSRLPRVADNPQVRTLGFHFRSLAKQSSVWIPRLVESSSCHSSTMIALSSDADCLKSG